MNRSLRSRASIYLAATCLATVMGLHATRTAAADTTVVVTPNDIGVTWYPADTRAPGTGAFEAGPSTPPFGLGSFQLDTRSDNAAKVQLLTDLYDTTRLADIDGIGYSTYRDPASTGFVAGVSSINLRIDLDGGGTSDAYMVYEPYVDQGNAAVLTDVWQTWDAYAGGAAKWWINTGAGGCGQGSPCSWSAILALFPNATIREAPACGPGNVTVPCPGSAGVNQGSFNLGFLSNVDGFYLSVLGERTTFDFQPNPRSDLSIFIQALKGAVVAMVVASSRMPPLL